MVENEKLRNENKKLKQQRVMDKCSLEDLRNKDKKTKYLTGFPDFDTMEIMYTEVERFLPYSIQGKLSKFDVFLITFLKLRLDLPFTYLAYKYSVSTKTISNLFHTAVVCIHQRLQSFVFWPDQQALRENTPAAFKNLFGDKNIFIIDCFEVFSERPGKV